MVSLTFACGTNGHSDRDLLIHRNDIAKWAKPLEFMDSKPLSGNQVLILREVGINQRLGHPMPNPPLHSGQRSKRFDLFLEMALVFFRRAFLGAYSAALRIS